MSHHQGSCVSDVRGLMRNLQDFYVRWQHRLCPLNLQQTVTIACVLKQNMYQAWRHKHLAAAARIRMHLVYLLWIGTNCDGLKFRNCLCYAHNLLLDRPYKEVAFSQLPFERCHSKESHPQGIQRATGTLHLRHSETTLQCWATPGTPVSALPTQLATGRSCLIACNGSKCASMDSSLPTADLM